MYINTFKYTPEDVDCKLCPEYVKKFGCTACGCPGWPSALRRALWAMQGWSGRCFPMTSARWPAWNR